MTRQTNEKTRGVRLYIEDFRYVVNVVRRSLFLQLRKEVYLTVYEMKQAFLLGKTIFDLPLNVSYYARVSTDKEEQINSLENQVSFFEEYIKKNSNWTFIRWLC